VLDVHEELNGKVKNCLSSCEEQVIQMEKICIDSTTEKVIDISLCGSEPEIINHTCNHALLPICPTINFGMIEDLRNINAFSLWNRCSKIYSGELTYKTYVPPNLPAIRESYLDDASILCGLDENSISHDGFTVSILIYLSSIPSSSHTKIFSIGKSEAKPFINFRIQRWGRKDAKFSVISRRNKYITRLRTNNWIGRWVHLVATWHPRDGNSVFVDGVKQGWSYVIRSRSAPRVSFTTRDIALFVGSSIKTKKIQKTVFDGYLTSLVLWNQSLSDQQSRETYRFYESHLTKSNLEAPLLIAPFMMKFLTGLFWPEFNHCFKKEMSLKDFTELSCTPQFPVIEEDDIFLEYQPLYEYSPFYF